MIHNLSQRLFEWLLEFGVTEQQISFIHAFTAFAVLCLSCLFLWIIIRLVIIRIVKKIVSKTEATWDDHLFKYHVFRYASLVLIASIISVSMPVIFQAYPLWKRLMSMSADIYVVIASLTFINSLLNALVAIIDEMERYRDKPIRSYKQVTKIIFYVIGGVLITAIVLDKSPIYVLTGLGAVTAILLLVFKDPILGFVASVQMSAVDLVRVGDWITVDKYGADGEVMEINLTTVKVRNWDMTITVVPSYAMVSESFKNWRGMQESDGRRIKRHLNIKISSIQFIDEALYEKLLKIERIREYLQNRNDEIVRHNSTLNVDKSILLNGRHLTNIGVFRIYAETYLKEIPGINHQMTCMVRQLQPNEHGIPLEIYAFSSEKKLENFEGLMADLFDHLLAAVPYFDMEIFQSPSSSDIRLSALES